MKCHIPVSEKYLLSTEEAAQYFNLGINKLRRIIRENPYAEWLLWNGSHSKIKRKVFEKYLDVHNAI